MRARKKITAKALKAIPCQQVLASLMAHIPGHVYWKDRQGVYLGCNDRQAQSLGLQSGEEVVGKTDFELPWQADLARLFWENDREVLTTGRAITIEETAVVDTQPAIVWSLKVPLKTGRGQIVGILGISVDITAQKRAEAKLIAVKEAAEVGYQAKIAFLEDMRHDIRTPIAGLLGCIDVIRDYIAHPSVVDNVSPYVEALETSSHALLALLNRVLVSTEAIRGALPIRQLRFDLKERVQQVLQLNQARAKQKKLRLTLEHDAAIPYLVGDSDRIERIVLELVTNALNFTEQGSVKIRTQLVIHKEQKVMIKIQVEDTGIGIPSEIQPMLFSPFKRCMPASKGHSSGAGLGLSIIKHYIEDLDGEIYLQSQPQQGSLFTCVLPLKAALLQGEGTSPQVVPFNKQSSLKNIPDSDYDLSEEKGSRPRLLIVEDDRIVMKVMERLFTKLHCNVEVAPDAKSALRQAKKQSYALILLDIGLPDGSGDEVASAIRQNEACPNQTTPIVAISAHVDGQSKKACQLAGINLVLTKPLSESLARQILHVFL